MSRKSSNKFSEKKTPRTKWKLTTQVGILKKTKKHFENLLENPTEITDKSNEENIKSQKTLNKEWL